jgi:dihydropteroate synthase
MSPAATRIESEIDALDMFTPRPPRCLFMGVVNVTPDSFSDGGDFISVSAAAERALRLAEQGADILDIGGESTRPGALPVPPVEELRRVVPVIEEIRRHCGLPLSIDTRNAVVAEAALDSGADIINDVSALRHDPRMAGTAAGRNAPVILMHMLGTPEIMQNKPSYADVTAEVRAFLAERIEFAAAAGISKVAIDPGIGFGKRFEDNLTLLRELRSLCSLGRPVLVGTSRKRFLGEITGNDPRNRVPETIASCVIAVLNGAMVLRVHDVREVRAAVRVAEAVNSGKPGGA